MASDGPSAPRIVDAALLRALADSLPAMLAYWDANRRCRYANRAYETWFGVAPETLVGRHMRDLLGPSLYALNLPHIEGALRGEPQEFEREIPDPAGGPPRYSQAYYVPDVSDGKTHGFSVLVVDITRRKRSEETVLVLERQLQATERQSAMATLAGGIAHELNNPLASVLLSLELTLAGIERGELDASVVKGALVEARESALRMSTILQSMRLLARGDVSKREPVDVAETLEGALRVVANVIRHRATLVRDIAEVGAVEANAPRLAQVFVSLLMNAAQALPEDGAARNEIHVSTRREGSEVVVEIADNGSGISEELQSRIFEPFFTTRDVGAGRGLGLSTAIAFVKAIAGTIAVRSKVGEGSSFEVRLPVARAPQQRAEARVAPRPDPAARDGGGETEAVRPRLLVVDDEVALARSLRLLLADQFDVTTVNRGREAIAMLTRAEPDFDVILCDLMMPELSGAELHAEATRARPELDGRFVFMTGGAFTARGQEFLDRVKAPVLDKPFTPAALLEVLVGRLKSARR